MESGWRWRVWRGLYSPIVGMGRSPGLAVLVWSFWVVAFWLIHNSEEVRIWLPVWGAHVAGIVVLGVIGWRSPIWGRRESPGGRRNREGTP